MPFSNLELSSTYTTTMKLTGDGSRPFAKDVFDLFSAMILQLNLGDHRSFFRTYPSTFTTDEAAACLKALKFSHVVKTPEPNNNGYRLTRTTTTFYMERVIAKALLQQFLNTRLIMIATDTTARTVRDKGIWALTSKGKRMIIDFGERAFVPVDHMAPHLDTINTVSVFALDRIKETDQLAFERDNITLCFKIMMTKIPLENILADDVGGLQHHYLEEYTHTFFGYQCFEWLMQYTTVVNRGEADMVAGELVLYGWIAHILDKSDLGNNTFDDSVLFRTSRNALYHITERGRLVLGWADSRSSAKSVSSTSSQKNSNGKTKKQQLQQALPQSLTSIYASGEHSRPASISNSETDVLTSTDDAAQFVRLRQILEDPLLRMYFRIYLKDNFCDENINFWVDYFAMRKKKKAQHTKNGLKDMVSDSYAIYDTYLKSKAVHEVNIDHTLRKNIDALVKSTFSIVYEPKKHGNNSSPSSSAPPFASPAVTPHSTATTAISVNAPLAQCLHDLMKLYDQVNDHLCKMMAEDSVPRFLRTSKYQKLLNAHLPPLPPPKPIPEQQQQQQQQEQPSTSAINQGPSAQLATVTQLTDGINTLACKED